MLMKDDQEGAIDQLQAERSLAWVRDDVSNAYPLHIAAWRVRFVLTLGDKCKSYPPDPLSFIRQDLVQNFSCLLIVTDQIRMHCDDA